MTKRWVILAMILMNSKRQYFNLLPIRNLKNALLKWKNSVWNGEKMGKNLIKSEMQREPGIMDVIDHGFIGIHADSALSFFHLRHPPQNISPFYLTLGSWHAHTPTNTHAALPTFCLPQWKDAENSGTPARTHFTRAALVWWHTCWQCERMRSPPCYTGACCTLNTLTLLSVLNICGNR